MSATDPQPFSTDYPLMQIEASLGDLSTSIGILAHLAHSAEAVQTAEWDQIIGRLSVTAQQLREQWDQAWEQRKLERDSYEAALAVATAEREAPGSLAHAAYARSLWRTLRSVARLIIEQCDRAEGLGELPPRR